MYKCPNCHTRFTIGVRDFCSEKCMKEYEESKNRKMPKGPNPDIVKCIEYPVTRIPNMLYFVGKDGYIYYVPMKRGGGRRKI